MIRGELELSRRVHASIFRSYYCHRQTVVDHSLEEWPPRKRHFRPMSLRTGLF